MNQIKIFYDVETTGLNYKKHNLHQLAGYVEINGKIVEAFDIRSKPHPKAEITKEALCACKLTKEEIMAYPEMSEGYREFIRILSNYIDKFNPKIKAWLIGFNNRYFDDSFLRSWFELNGDEYINSWFWGNTIDAMVLASQYLLKRRINMPSFKQKRVAKELGIEVDETKLHDALYDAYLTRKIYRIVTGEEIEL